MQNEFEQKLQQWVEIPSVSAAPDHRNDIDRMAHAAAESIRAFGGDAELVMTPGNPVVIGRFFQSPQFPTVTVYNHLDVQPANEPQWKREPFVFHKDGGRYFGRGATDDKGPALTALFATRQAIREGVRINIQFIWELEEEIGSPNFEAFMKTAAARLRTDSIAVSDTIWVSRGKPAIAYGLRGLAPFRVILQTGSKDVHSGLTGGAARNPIGELCQIVAECYDATTGRVKIPGFYDNVLPLTREELDGFVSSGFNTRRFKTAHELKSLRVEDEKEVVKRIWATPTFEVHGLVGGYTGPGVKTAIAPSAEVKISMRLVPKQNPDQVFRLVRAFIRKRHPDAQVVPESFLKPFHGPRHGPCFEAARTAVKAAFGKEPAFVREGGSIGAVVTMQKYLKAPILLLGLSLPEHGYHAPNENFDWEQAEGGMRMFVHYFRNLSAIPQKRIR